MSVFEHLKRQDISPHRAFVEKVAVTTFKNIEFGIMDSGIKFIIQCSISGPQELCAIRVKGKCLALRVTLQ